MSPGRSEGGGLSQGGAQPSPAPSLMPGADLSRASTLLVQHQELGDDAWVEVGGGKGCVRAGGKPFFFSRVRYTSTPAPTARSHPVMHCVYIWRV